MQRFLVFVVIFAVAGYFGYTHYYGKPADPGSSGAGGPTPLGQAGQVQAAQDTPAPRADDGYALLAAGKAKEAAAAFETLIPKLETGSGAELPKALYHLGSAYLQINNPTAAARAFQRVVDKFPSDANAGNAMVMLGRIENDPQKKQDWIAKAAELHPQATELGPVALEVGNRLLDDGKEVEGWRVLTAAMFSPLPPDQRQKARERLEPIVKKHVFSPTITPGSTVYTVKSGDTLGRIAKAHRVDVGVIKRANGMKSDSIYPNQRLKILQGNWFIDVSLSQFRLIVMHERRWVREFTVGVGNPEASPTPLGRFTIKDKLIDPPWKGVPYGDPRNILGTRWMGLEGAPSYGIHGTTQPETVGKPLSAGCVRMVNSDVEYLYDLVVVGTEVVIHE